MGCFESIPTQISQTVLTHKNRSVGGALLQNELERNEFRSTSDSTPASTPVNLNLDSTNQARKYIIDLWI